MKSLAHIIAVLAASIALSACSSSSKDSDLANNESITTDESVIDSTEVTESTIPEAPVAETIAPVEQPSLGASSSGLGH